MRVGGGEKEWQSAEDAEQRGLLGGVEKVEDLVKGLPLSNW